MSSKKMREELDDLGLPRKGIADGPRMVASRRHEILCNVIRFKTAFLKIPGVVCRISQLLHQGVRSGLFGEYQDLLNAIELFAEREKLGYIISEGETPMGRQQMLVGVTLTNEDVIISGERSWVRADLLQAEDHAHRIGRRRDVIRECIVSEGTFYDLMWAVCCKLS